jgi:hypothetical protein
VVLLASGVADATERRSVVQDGAVPSDSTTVIRPSAVLNEVAAGQVLRELEYRDVSRGGVWNASVGLWQRYDNPWNGDPSGPGTAKVVGSIGTVYGTPGKYDITIYRVTISEHGQATGWTVESLTDEALRHAGLTLATCPRTALLAPPTPDPFKRPGT